MKAVKRLGDLKTIVIINVFLFFIFFVLFTSILYRLLERTDTIHNVVLTEGSQELVLAIQPAFALTFLVLSVFNLMIAYFINNQQRN